MRYNELTYHKASPFYKQDYLPDRAWYNRKPKDFPSEIPTGQDYFVDNGRKHFNQRFNHSEIASESILQSPERYPFENRIANDKTYMRNLDTIDIEGASSGTRLNQSIKNKLKAQEELARRNNQSLDMREHKDKTYDEKRREIALKQYQTLQDRKVKQSEQQSNTITPKIREHSLSQQQEADLALPQNYTTTNNYSSRYVRLLPKPYYAHLEQKGQSQEYLKEVQNRNVISKSERKAPEVNQPMQNEQYYQQQQSYEPEAELRRYESALEKERKQESYNMIPTNNRHKSNPECYNAFDVELQRRREEYLKHTEMDEVSKNKLQDKKQFRKYNPTNLSFNLAAQSIVGNNR